MLKRLAVITIFLIALVPCGSSTGRLVAQQDASPVSGAMRLNDAMLSSLRQISETLERNGQLDQALDLLFQYREDTRVLGIIQLLCDKSGREEEFLPFAVEAYEREPGDQSALVIYLHALQRVGLNDSLFSVAGRFLDLGEPKAEKFELIGRQFRIMGHPAKALGVFSKARIVLNEQRLFRDHAAACLVDLEQWGKALDELFLYFYDNPGEFATVQAQLYRIISDGGEQGSAMVVRTLERELPKVSDERRLSLQRLLIDIRLTRREEREALKMLDGLASSVDRQTALNHISIFIGRALKLESYEIALDAYDLADRLEVLGRDRILLGRATLFERMARYGEAREALIEMVNLDPPSPFRIQAMNLLGDLCSNRLNNPAEALEWYRRIEAEDSGKEREHSAIKLSIARSFIHMNRLEDARDLCAELLTSELDLPEVKPEAARLLADVHFYSGAPDSAAEGYLGYARTRLGEPEVNDAIERAFLIRNDPSKDRTVSRRVGEALHAAAIGEFQRSAGLFQQAMEEAQDSTFRTRVSFEMGKMYQQAGDFPLAAGVYEEILLSSPEHYLAPAVELRFSIMLLDNLGDREGARRHLENIVFNRPEGVVTPQARRLLRKLEDAKL